MIALSEAVNRLARHSPRKWPGRRGMQRAAVALLLAEGARGLEVMMIRRAEHPDDPWSGHMAFPGGRMDPGDDASAYACALRETEEETGIALPVAARCVGRLSDLQASGSGRLLPLIITPFVFAAPAPPPAAPDEREVAEVVWVPLALFTEPGRRGSMEWQFEGRQWQLPCYFHEGRRIWGLSLQMLDELVKVVTTI